MNYLSKYGNRVNFWGENEIDQFRNMNITNFKYFLQQTPNKLFIGDSIVGATIYDRFSGYNETSYYILTELDKPLSIGSIVTDIGGTNWIVATNENINVPTYNRYKILKVDNTISWYDSKGKLQSTACLIIGTLKTKLKETFDINNDVILPTDNGEVLIIMPNTGIKMNTRFILGSRAWKVSGFDVLSVSGLVFLSLQ